VPAAGTLRESAAESRFAAIPPVVSTGAVSASHAPAGAQPTPVPAAPPGDGLAPGWFAARDLDVLPRPLAPIEFAYPPTARAAGVSGKVVLQLSIDAAGRLIDIEVVRADPRGVFEAAALAAFRAVRYSPGLRDGRAVPSRIRTVAVFDASAVAGSELPR